MKKLISFLVMALVVLFTAPVANAASLVLYNCWSPTSAETIGTKVVCAEYSTETGMGSPAYPCAYDICFAAGVPGSLEYLLCLKYLKCEATKRACEYKCRMPMKNWGYDFRD